MDAGASAQDTGYAQRSAARVETPDRPVPMQDRRGSDAVLPPIGATAPDMAPTTSVDAGDTNVKPPIDMAPAVDMATAPDAGPPVGRRSQGIGRGL